MAKLPVKYKNPRPGHELEDVRASPQSAEAIPMNRQKKKLLKWKEERKKSRKMLAHLPPSIENAKKKPSKVAIVRPLSLCSDIQTNAPTVVANPQSAVVPDTTARKRKNLKWKEELNKRKRQANTSKEILTKPSEVVAKKKVRNLSTTPTNDDVFISCYQLNYLLQKSSRYLIIDTRQKINYDKSRIVSNHCINIPKSEIKSGMLGLYYLEWIQEDMHSYKLYTHRSEIYVDIIILLDWDTTQKSLTSINGLYILKDLLENWDRGTVYKKIKILNGGYQEWLARYPAFATNPSVDETEVEVRKSNRNNTKASIIKEINKDYSLRRSSKYENKRSSRKRVTFCDAFIDLT